METAKKWNRDHPGKGHITIPFVADDNMIEELIRVSES